MPEICLWFGSRGPFWWERGGLCRCRWSQKLTRYIVMGLGGSPGLLGVRAGTFTRPPQGVARQHGGGGWGLEI